MPSVPSKGLILGCSEIVINKLQITSFKEFVIDSSINICETEDGKTIKRLAVVSHKPFTRNKQWFVLLNTNGEIAEYSLDEYNVHPQDGKTQTKWFEKIS